MSTENEGISSETLFNLEVKILRARMIFCTQQAWFGSLIGKLKLRISTDNQRFPTCATDGETVYFGAEFVRKITIEELVFVFGHEILHCLLNHHFRKTSDRDMRTWNYACDYVVNDLLVKGGIGVMPKGALYDPNYSGKTCEEIYGAISKMSKEKKDALQTLDDHSAMNGEGFDEVSVSSSKGNGNDEGEDFHEMSPETAEKWADTLEKVEKEIRGAIQGRGAGLEKSLANLLNAESPDIDRYTSLLDWRDELREFIKEKFSTDMTYMKPNKKAQGLGFSLPTMRTEEMLNIAIALDTSGSMNPTWITNFLGEIQEILLSYEFGSIHLWCFDTSIHKYEILDSSDVQELSYYKPVGGGGTEFEVNWKHLEDEGLKPDLLLMLTDGHPGSSWGDEHVVDALFAIAGNPERNVVAPFGKTVYID